MDDFELLEFSEDLEEIQKGVNIYDFPAVFVGEGRIYFNRASTQFLQGVHAVRFYTSTNYVVMEPALKGGASSFTIIRQTVTNPSALKAKAVKNGWYKLYRCKNGFAFKRYEQLGEVA